LIQPKLTLEHSAVASYHLFVVESGDVVLPLYLSMVAVSSNTTILDFVGTIAAFIIVSLLICKQAATGSSLKDIL